MKLNARIAASAGMLAAFGVCWWLLSQEADSPDRGKPTRVGTVAQPDLPSVAWPEAGSPAFKALAGARTQSWLQSRGRDAAGLVAMWDLTGDTAYLDEAASRFPGDPRVCMAMISLHQWKAVNALPWVEKLTAAEPENSYAWYLRVWALRAAPGSKAAGLEAGLDSLRKASACNVPGNKHAAERAMLLREAAQSAGMPPALASRVAVGEVWDRMLDCRLGGSINRLFEGAVQKAREQGDTARIAELERLGLAAADSLRDNSLVARRFSKELEGQVIALQSPENSGDARTDSLRAAAVARREIAAPDLPQPADVTRFLEKCGGETAVAFAENMIRQGEFAAVTALPPQVAVPKP